MKKSLLLTAALVSAVLSTSVFAAEPPCTCVTPTKAAPAISKPAVVSIVHPTGLSRQYENVTVKVTFIVDEKGVPRDVRPFGFMDHDLASKLLPIVAQWRFSPSKADGHPIATRVVMPLQLVEGA